MHATSLKLLSFSLLILIMARCSNSNNSKSLATWIGEYSYGEEPVKAIAGYSMVMIWDLTININGDSCQGILEVNGQQTYIKLLTNITGDSNAITITYDRVIDGSNENLKKNDTLFILSRNAGVLKTKWFELEPRLLENPGKECNCFSKEK